MKLSIVKKEFFVNKNNVICKVRGHLHMDGGSRGTVVAKGMATASPEDTFNLEIGKKIALARAESNLYTEAKKVLNDVIKSTERTLKDAYEFCEKASGVRRHNKEDIHKISE